jgi:hypothetical protein
VFRTQLAALLALAGMGLAGCGGDDGHRARPSDRFVDSIGVNVHMSYDDTGYRDRAAVRDALRDLGVRHVRDGNALGAGGQYAALRELARDGIGVDLILGDPVGSFGSGTLEQQLASLKGELRGAVSSIEGPNEFDGRGGAEWPRLLRDYQERLYRMVEDDPALTGLPVIGPSLIDINAWSRVGKLGDSFDYGNIHPYAGGEPPRPGHVDDQLDLVARGSGSDPVYATEAGYHNAISAPPEAQAGVSERAAAVYVPRLFLEHFRGGIERTYLYELLDEHPDPAGTDVEQHFGLIRSDSSRKPAFTALRNLVALLRDPGPEFEAGSLDFSLKAGDSVEALLLQKRDGTFYLALWRPNTSAWSRAAGTDLDPPPALARVRFAKRAKLVRAYAPVQSARAVRSWANAESVSLELRAEPLVLEIAAG